MLRMPEPSSISGRRRIRRVLSVELLGTVAMAAASSGPSLQAIEAYEADLKTSRRRHWQCEPYSHPPAGGAGCQDGRHAGRARFQVPGALP